MDENIKKLGNLIEKSNNILLINHIRMDPDAFGSLMSFYHILKKLNKNVKAINDEKMPENFSFLDDNIFEIDLNLKSFNPELIISFDVASLSQLGNSYINNEIIFKNTPFVVIDHHITNPGFGSINIINTASSSTCELVFDILSHLNLNNHIDTKIATLLNAGIITDTNIYYNVNTTINTIKVAYELKKLGADSRSSIFEFFKKKSFEKTKLWGIALNNTKKTNDNKIVYTTLTIDDYQHTNTQDRDVNGIIDMLINIDKAEIAFIIYPLDNGGNKVSFRSNYYNVSELCENFGGGGHKQAAGFSTNETNLDKIIDNILKNINIS